MAQVEYRQRPTTPHPGSDRSPNRRRIRRDRGKRPLRKRGELLERPCAHLYETGGLRRAHVRGHANVLKRLLIHAGAFNLGLWMRMLFGVGTPRGLQGRLVALVAVLSAFWSITRELVALIRRRTVSPPRSVRAATKSLAGA